MTTWCKIVNKKQLNTHTLNLRQYVLALLKFWILYGPSYPKDTKKRKRASINKHIHLFII